MQVVGAGMAVSAALPLGAAAVVAAGAAGAGPSAEALADIPGPLLGAYRRAAAACPGLAWSVVAAVGKVESDHGRSGGARLGADGAVSPPIVGVALDGAGVAAVADTDGGRLDGDATWDRAVGPMQFLPATWAAWGRDGSGDGRADPQNAFDAVASAGAYLCGPDGRVDDVAAALRSYNRSDAYVAEVAATAAAYDAAAPLAPAAAGVVSHPGLVLSPSARADLASGRIDRRLVSVLALAAARFEVAVGVIRTGHDQCVGGGSRAERPRCRVSHHWHGRGVDLVAVGGRAVGVGNAEARALVEMLRRLPADLRPDEIGVPWAALDPLPGVFSDAAHRSHLHLGWGPAGGGHPLPTTQGGSP